MPSKKPVAKRGVKRSVKPAEVETCGTVWKPAGKPGRKPSVKPVAVLQPIGAVKSTAARTGCTRKTYNTPRISSQM